MTTLKRTVMTSLAVLALALDASAQTASPRLTRRECGLKSPLAVSMAARATPVVGQSLTLTIQVYNGLREGAVRTTILVPAGCAEVVAGSLTTEGYLTLGGSRSQELRLKILTAEPFDLVAKVASLDSRDSRLPPGESIVPIRPVNLGPTGPSVSWNPLTLRSNSKPAPPVVRLRDGRSVIRIRIPTP